MNFIVLLFILLIVLPNYVDNRKPMETEPWLLHKYQRKSLKILSKDGRKSSRRKRNAHCGYPCQSRSCCQRTRCVCVRDYWGPSCYCRK